MVIWLTGLSAAGKTTICRAIWNILKPSTPELVIVDGDNVRDLFSQKLGYTEPERRQQIQRIQALALMMSNQRLKVLVAALYSHPDLLAWNRRHFDRYFEVYIDAPLSLVQRRDPKQLYAKAARGEMPDVVGIDIPWHPPATPDLVVDATLGESPTEIANRIICSISTRETPTLVAV